MLATSTFDDLRSGNGKNVTGSVIRAYLTLEPGHRAWWDQHQNGCNIMNYRLVKTICVIRICENLCSNVSEVSVEGLHILMDIFTTLQGGGKLQCEGLLETSPQAPMV